MEKSKSFKLLGGYKKQGWAIKVLDRISNENIEEEDGLHTFKAVLEGQDLTYYPAFLTLDLAANGEIQGLYLIAESEEAFELVPFEMAQDKLNVDELLPFRYRTIEKAEQDEKQQNWPDFS